MLTVLEHRPFINLTRERINPCGNYQNKGAILCKGCISLRDYNQRAIKLVNRDWCFSWAPEGENWPRPRRIRSLPSLAYTTRDDLSSWKRRAAYIFSFRSNCSLPVKSVCFWKEPDTISRVSNSSFLSWYVWKTSVNTNDKVLNARWTKSVSRRKADGNTKYGRK